MKALPSLLRNNVAPQLSIMAITKRNKADTDNAQINRAVHQTAFSWDGDTLVLNILGKPSAKHDAIGKFKGRQLKVSVTEVPRGGKATDHMVRFLEAEFGVSMSNIEVVFGRMNVNKQLRIRAPTRLPAVIGPQDFLST